MRTRKTLGATFVVAVQFAAQSAAMPEASENAPPSLLRRVLPLLVTVMIFAWIFQRVPFARFWVALAGADHARFLAMMLPNGLLYFAWDTLLLTLVMRWFHGPIGYRELLPVRAVTYVVSFLNTNLARAATAYYLTRKLGTPFFPIAGTVLFLTLLDLTHLTLWAAVAMTLAPERVPAVVAVVAAGVLLFWLVTIPYARGADGSGRGRWWSPRDWSLFATFARAPLKRYGQVILLRAPLFAASLLFHYYAVQSFGMHIPFGRLAACLPVIFMLAALPVTVAHLGTTQAAWIFFFRDVAPPEALLAYSLASHLAFMLARASVGLVFLPTAHKELFGPIKLGEFFTAREPRAAR